MHLGIVISGFNQLILKAIASLLHTGKCKMDELTEPIPVYCDTSMRSIDLSKVERLKR